MKFRVCVCNGAPVLFEPHICVVSMKLNKDRWGSLGICVTSLLLWLSHYSSVTFMLENQPVHHLPWRVEPSLFFTTREWSAWQISSFLFKFALCSRRSQSSEFKCLSACSKNPQDRVSQQVASSFYTDMKLHRHALGLCVASHKVIIKTLLDMTGRLKHTEAPGTDRNSKKTHQWK